MFGRPPLEVPPGQTDFVLPADDVGVLRPELAQVIPTQLIESFLALRVARRVGAYTDMPNFQIKRFNFVLPALHTVVVTNAPPEPRAFKEIIIS